ncbi:DUF6069 family protein [Streptomonospora litoralis]|uniref:Uncharacterized protein n=1 Tax=Streptomonospora litoralis TaxID=2498135 RepID=A0A4P6Q6K2_9ACTN|nr:DUF6069 family protein [Streptomonospora litoralis]QBI56303.1 hypothetical protein EKD16_22750 [Streptomonospora litoralis]
MSSPVSRAESATASTPHPADGGSRRRPAVRRAAALAGAAAASLACWAVAAPVAGIDLTAYKGGAVQPVGAGSVVFAALLAGSAAWLLMAVLERTVQRPRRIWTVAAVAVLVLSLAGPLVSAAGTASMLVLMGLHAVPAAVLIPVMGPTAAARR